MLYNNLGQGEGFEFLKEMPPVGSTVVFHAPCGTLGKVIVSKPYLINLHRGVYPALTEDKLVWVVNFYYLGDEKETVSHTYVTDVSRQIESGVVLPPRPKYL